MRFSYQAMMLSAAVALLSACDNTPPTPVVADKQPGQFRVVSWNMEHLAYPIDSGCKPRDAATLQELKSYAASLDADVVAVQEVSSKQALAQVFDESQWQIVMSERPDNDPYDCRGNGLKSTPQKVGFAVKRALAINSVNNLDTLALGNPGLRYGVALTLDTPMGETQILNLHMKSGCFIDDYRKDEKRACQVLERQAPVLFEYIENAHKAGTQLLVVGDMNHRLAEPANQFMKDLKARINGTDIQLYTKDVMGCHPRYPVPIDHAFMVGKKVTATAGFHYFNDMREDKMLSDHCALSVTFN